MGTRLNKIFNTLEECPPEYNGSLPNRFINIKNDTYNFLTVLYLVGFKNHRSEWLCKCNNCGRYVIVNSHNLRSGHTKTCGCLISEKLRIDKVGKQYGTLKVIKYDCSKNEMPYYIVECQNCGRVYSINGHSLERQFSCGCILSKKAELIFNELKQQYNDVIREKTFDKCYFRNPLRFDFYLPSENKIIEYDGIQHFQPSYFSNNTSDSQAYKNFISQQVKDWYKDFYCIQNNINLFRIKYNDNSNITAKDLLSKQIKIDKYYSKNINLFDILETDSINYKEITFNILAGISCTFKCCKDNPSICQNCDITKNNILTLNIDNLINKYLNQDISHSVTFQGLEILDNLKQLLWFIYYFRQKNQDPIIIWTGYTEEECEDLIYLIQNIMKFENIIIKYGRYIPGQEPHYDEVLGVKLASNNQYAEKIS